MNNKKLSHSEFKTLARKHQIAFKTTDPDKGGLGIERSPERVIHRRNKDGEISEYIIPVESSLQWADCKDAAGNYVIFYEAILR